MMMPERVVLKNVLFPQNQRHTDLLMSAKKKTCLNTMKVTLNQLKTQKNCIMMQHCIKNLLLLLVIHTHTHTLINQPPEFQSYYPNIQHFLYLYNKK